MSTTEIQLHSTAINYSVACVYTDIPLRSDRSCVLVAYRQQCWYVNDPGWIDNLQDSSDNKANKRVSPNKQHASYRKTNGRRMEGGIRRWQLALVPKQRKLDCRDKSQRQ